MTEVSFHFNVADRTAYTCGLVRDMSRRAAVVLTGPVPALTRLDRALWTFDSTDFVPHVLLRPGQPVPERLRRTRVWLAADAAQPGPHECLINLGDEAPAGFESFETLVEVVSTDEADRAQARLRWKHYAARGYDIRRVEQQEGAR
ncbi:MAG TPA: DNA polymerase III subunit chi [Burkholderiaceae bacterium]|nr:DNA polymerase III subunit chi [Burkholderiaceae bacterium]